MAIKEKVQICDSCLDAGLEEGEGFGISAKAVCLMFGSEIPGHLCDTIVSEGEVRCDCACYQDEKKKVRMRYLG